MQQIRFRGKPCYMGGNQSAWVYGTFQYIAQRRVRPGATDNGTLEPRNDKGRIVDLYGTETEVLCDTVGQYTGLHDRKDHEIYDGDIIFVEFADKSGGNQLVGWNEETASWGIMSTYEYQSLMDGDDWPEFKNHTLLAFLKHAIVCEVVGNIHDNPELLKEY